MDPSQGKPGWSVHVWSSNYTLKQFVWGPANDITYVVFCQVRPSTVRRLWAAHINPPDTSVAELLHEALLFLLAHDILIE